MKALPNPSWRLVRFIGVTSLGLAGFKQGAKRPDFQDRFGIDKGALSSTGENRYFVLRPGTKRLYASGDERLVITVLDETEVVDGVTTREVEERETKGGQLIEVSRNFFAIDPKSKDVYYFGEDVDMVRNGKVVSHEGAWQSGKDGARFGLIMPGNPKFGLAFYLEVAPKVAMDRARLLSISATAKTPAGTFENCLSFEDTTPLETDAKETKVYAPGIGLVMDADLKLVKRTE